MKVVFSWVSYDGEDRMISLPETDVGTYNEMLTILGESERVGIDEVNIFIVEDDGRVVIHKNYEDKFGLEVQWHEGEPHICYRKSIKVSA